MTDRGVHRLAHHHVPEDDDAGQGGDDGRRLVGVLPFLLFVGAFGAGGIQDRGAVRRAHPGQDLAGRDVVAFIDEELFDASADRRLDLDAVERQDFARGFDGLLDRSEPGFHGLRCSSGSVHGASAPAVRNRRPLPRRGACLE